ncbi:hypothetical protein FA09DRAFT_46456 [Tilletiopsis washingtonensis]|jgi:hypothetical protein|uniref:Uncharacterized protein n=1 Tax=Tilletiopsis washingtonensis TaxID=58919 RepID=A0A316Z9T7_9BASI|nr:hypothetical protein FA09DRAFT_46456 [Tilletiopsis washingtonensis]PWN97768.1 hypothetical protein FA09DRAFT_46456 [Tilletiopsis washingtonensis]
MYRTPLYSDSHSYELLLVAMARGATSRFPLLRQTADADAARGKERRGAAAALTAPNEVPVRAPLRSDSARTRSRLQDRRASEQPVGPGVKDTGRTQSSARLRGVRASSVLSRREHARLSATRSLTAKLQRGASAELRPRPLARRGPEPPVRSGSVPPADQLAASAGRQPQGGRSSCLRAQQQCAIQWREQGGLQHT